MSLPRARGGFRRRSRGASRTPALRRGGAPCAPGRGAPSPPPPPPPPRSPEHPPARPPPDLRPRRPPAAQLGRRAAASQWPGPASPRRDPAARRPAPAAGGPGPGLRPAEVSSLRPADGTVARGPFCRPGPSRRPFRGAGRPPPGTTFPAAEGLLPRRRRRWRRARHGGGGAPEVEGRRPAQASARPTRFARPLPPLSPRPAMAEPSPARRPVPLIESGKTHGPRPPRGVPGPRPDPDPLPPARPRLTRLPVFPQSCTSSSPGTSRPARVGEPPR